jgi:hypothetical protein
MTMVVRIKPAEGLRVRKPCGKLLNESGETVVLTTFWQRRIDGGDVVDMGAAKDGDVIPDTKKRSRG